MGHGHGRRQVFMRRVVRRLILLGDMAIIAQA